MYLNDFQKEREKSASVINLTRFSESENVGVLTVGLGAP